MSILEFELLMSDANREFEDRVMAFEGGELEATSLGYGILIQYILVERFVLTAVSEMGEEPTPGTVAEFGHISMGRHQAILTHARSGDNGQLKEWLDSGDGYRGFVRSLYGKGGGYEKPERMAALLDRLDLILGLISDQGAGIDIVLPELPWARQRFDGHGASQ